MNRHQVITGAVNSGDHCYSVGTVEGVNFTAYATGCDVVILSSDFQRVQIISGSNHGHVQVTCIDCSSDTGKIAACYGNKVYIYEPVPIFHRVSSHRLDYQWIETNVLICDSVITALSWNQEGTRLLTGGRWIQLWASPVVSETHVQPPSASTTGQFVSFSLGENDHGDGDSQEKWKEIWRCRTSSPVAHLEFSPDGRFFASVAKGDRLVKVWYRSRKVILPSQGNQFYTDVDDEKREYSFVYLPHPRAVTSFSWRKTSRYMPRGAVANMLLTSCLDNICRLWNETMLPDDGLLNIQHLDPLVTQNPKYGQHRHKRRLVERLKHMRKSFKKARTQHEQQPSSTGPSSGHTQGNTLTVKKEPVATLPSSYSVHDFHKVGVHGTGISPECHFHLAASINADTDIPLVPLLSSGSGEPLSFVIHWLNNKDMHFTWQAENLLHDLCKKALRTERHDDMHDHRAASPDPLEFEEEQEDAEAPVQNGLIAPTQPSKPKKAEKGSTNKFNTLRKKLPKMGQRTKSFDLLDEDTLSVTSSHRDRNSLQPQGSVIGSTAESAGSAPGDTLDREIENLVRNWHHSADLLFSIHPLDGSFLVWVVEWLDEEYPGAFRQPQVSFSARIPNALPLGDSVTTCCNLEVYSTHSAFLDLYSMIKLSDDKNALNHEANGEPPIVSMISCHQNGSLNLWRINFSDVTEFSAVVSLGHESRICGHRFRVNDMVSHPVLPLLLTTSHHNESNGKPKTPTAGRKMSQALLNFTLGKGFCSELILWKVDPVGPLSQSGGVTELARINSAALSAFSSCAWLPTLLPGWTLGNLSQTPSACFVASDGVSLRLYQAVIDAQLLLAEMYASLRKPSVARSESTISNASSTGQSLPEEQMDMFNIVSLQSSARPGCILALDHINDAKHDWQNTQFLHIFQEHVLRGKTSDSHAKNLEAVVDLTNLSNFEEFFYLTVLEKSPRGGSIMHMWSIALSSKPNADDDTENGAMSADEAEDDDVPLDESKMTTGVKLSPSNLKIVTSKVCCQQLPLPADIEVVSATAAAGHLSSSAIYPACYAPYSIATACSDGTIRFWRCQMEEPDGKVRSYFWEEWRMMLGHTSCLTVPGRILGLSCAYSARIACAFKASVDHIRHDRDEPQYNMSVAIFECESTGGSEWIQEDKIAIRGVHFAQTASPVPDPEDTLMAIRREKRSMDNLTRLMGMHEGLLPPAPYVNPFKLSNSETKISQKPWQSVSLDWVSMEDGSHVLTVGLGCQIMIFAAVSNDIAQENMKAMAETVPNAKRQVLRQASSFALPAQKGIYRWMRLRLITLDSQDGAPALPNQMAWVRTGLLLLGMDNEMYVYSQWRKALDSSGADMPDARCLSDYNLVRLNASPSRMKVNKTIPSLLSVEHLKKIRSRKTMTQMSHISKRTAILTDPFVMDRGLFEAARLASPVLPQYHPKQLMELLNFGRLRRVQAILAHLLRCVKSAIPSSDDNNEVQNEDEGTGRRSSLSRQLSMSRRKSVVLSPGTLGDVTNQVAKEEIPLDYIEIDSISPLPLFALLEADHYVGKRGDEDENYDALFNAEDAENGDETTLDDILDEEGSEEQIKKKRSSSKRDPSDIYAFHPNDARELVRHLTHMHLPGLSSLDQMHLLALADTVANCSGTLILDMEDEHTGPTPENVDACGLRYLLAVRQHVYLLRCLPLKQRAAIQKQGIESRYIAWAFHSENQQELLNAVQNIVHGGDLKWANIKELGIGWWLRNNTIFKTIIERLAKNAYQASQDPMDAALYYLAMKRKNVLHALFKVVADQRMMDFFSNDFTQDRWRKAALKNAFALLGKQRFEHAAAFFILGGAIRDAVDIIMTKLGDIQLALTIVRLYEEDEFGIVSENHIRILQDYVVEPMHEDAGQPEPSQVAACNDPFLKSLGHWTLKQYSQSLQVLLAEEAMDLTVSTENHSIFNFYDFLRNHPIVVRQVQNSTKAHRKDEISSVERKLFFKTAHIYFRAGCPLLALEVLCKLPEYFYDDVPDLSVDVKGMNGLDAVKSPPEPQMAQDFDWGTPSDNLAVPKEDKLELSWDDEENEEEDEDRMSDKGSVLEFGSPKRKLSVNNRGVRRDSLVSNVQDLSKRVDIMAQQLKFIAGLKILMEELGTLATGFEVDGGQLRFILYMWLEKEVKILKLLCYKSGAALTEKLRAIKPMDAESDERMVSGTHSDQLALHEALRVDNMDFEARLDKMARRKAWLKSNQQLLRSLIHYCQIYGSNGGGLASVYMELTLLAHELYQGSQQQQQQLLTPLPFLTTLPLLSAFISGPLTISSDPVTYVVRMAHDLLYTLSDKKSPPSPQDSVTSVYIVRDLALALSGIVYQSLCESDQFQAKNFQSTSGAIEGFAATLLNSGGYMFTMQRRRRNTMIDGRLIPTTQPSKWPGVQALRALLARERDENSPKLHVLLMETYIAVYLSMVSTGLAIRDVNLLFRLVGINFNVKTWSAIFGGGAKKVIRRSSSERRRSFISPNSESRLDPSKQRNMLNAKVLGHMRPTSASPTTAPVVTDNQLGTTTYQEVFVPPETSILQSMLAKPNIDTSADPPFFDYDSDESVPSDDEEQARSETEYDDEQSKRAETEHSDPHSYSWAILRLVVLKAAAKVIQQVLTTVSVEQQDLPVFSPVLHTTLKMLDTWQKAAVHALEDYGAAPEGFVPRAYGAFEDSVTGKKNPYAILLDPSNTPFQSDHPTASPVKRLWSFLIHQDYLQETFVKYMFKRRKTDLPTLDTISDLNSVDEAASRPMRDAIRIVHKDQDIVTAFTINHANQNLIALSTSKEIQEINIASLLDPEGWLQDESEFNLLTMKNQALEKIDPEFLVLQTPSDKPPADARSMASSLLPGAQVSTRGAYVLKGFNMPGFTNPLYANFVVGRSGYMMQKLNKRPYKEVRRLTSHPMLPYYLSGSADGSIRLWEFGHQKQLTTLRSTSSMAKINHLEFSSQGNKFAACDADGVVSFWQLGTSSSNAPPFISLQCHNKTCSAFTFLGSSSLIATAGHASEGRNVAIWDTLLPPRKSMVAAFVCHDTGSSSLMYASQQNLLITCGKKGDVCLFDIRQRQLRHKFQAHESGIRAVALDPTQEYFVTGSAEGDIKVWGLAVHNCLLSLPEEHKKQSFFRNSSSGVMQLSIDAQNRLFSCGADGFFKIRTLQPQDYIMHTFGQ